jgi:predicted AlkP superfamily pyrophosphatase or phosphodiesterase
LIRRHGDAICDGHGVVVRCFVMWCSLVAMAACAAGAARPARVVLISVDGLMPEAYTAPDAHGLKVPTLRRMAAAGAWAQRVESVFPTVTYPAHTSLVTGAPPGVHGITTNRPPDPLDKNQGGWRWYAEGRPTTRSTATGRGAPRRAPATSTSTRCSAS